MRWDVGIDLGTENVRMAELKTGPVLEEAAALAFRDGRETPVCGGNAAERLYGRTCMGMSVVRPLRDGVLENSFNADRMFHWLYRRMDTVNPRRRFNALITCAPFARPVQMEALLAAATDAGATSAALVRGDAAAALGAGLDLNAPEAKLVVDVGGGKLSATLFTFGRVAAYGHLPYGMGRIDERVERILRVESGYRIGRTAAREIKHTLGSALPEAAPRDVIMHMTGFSIADRLPRNFDVETKPVLDACEDVVRELAGLCASVVDGAGGAVRRLERHRRRAHRRGRGDDRPGQAHRRRAGHPLPRRGRAGHLRDPRPAQDHGIAGRLPRRVPRAPGRLRMAVSGEDASLDGVAGVRATRPNDSRKRLVRIPSKGTVRK